VHFLQVPETMPTESEMRSRRESWPPTQVRLEPPRHTKGEEPRPLLEDIDENPLTYFLTPAPAHHGDDDNDYAMDFDAGIEDPSHPHEMVRSVSPSTLDGLRKPDQDRPSSPECDSDVTSPDEDDDEDYIRFSPHNSRLTSFRDLHIDGLGTRSCSPVFGRSANALLSPASFPSPQSRIRGYPSGRLGRARTLPIRSRPVHLWREPSPDVWSIEEETEEEMSEMSKSMESQSNFVQESRYEGLDKMAAKPKKRVRFVLPVKE
jgi:hypothetical protein